VQLTAASIQQTFGGLSSSQWIHCNMKSKMKYTEMMHFLSTKFSLFYFLTVS